MSLANLIRRLNQNPIFKFTSSVKLAVPLMLTLGGLVAYGTVVESNYNSDYAKLTIYNTDWFLALLALLFLNIFNSTMSRYPWRMKQHLGFVVTHIGLLTLLTGAVITSFFGVDGQLRVSEGSANGTIVLPRLMLSYQLKGSPRAQSVVFDKTLSEKSGSSLGFINDSMGHVLHADKLLPFASVQKDFSKAEEGSDEVALSFILRSQFFNVSEWLHSKDNPEMQLGPATLRLIKDAPGLRVRNISAVKVAPDQPVRAHGGGGVGGEILIKESKDGKTLTTWDLAKKAFTWKDIHFVVKHKFNHAVVAQNKLVEGEDKPEINPAVELEISAGSKTLREILFAKFPNFSLNKSGVFGYVLEFRHDGAAADDEPAETAATHAAPTGGAMAPGAHVVEFHVDPAHPKQARVILYKDGKAVGTETLSEGQSYQTPWMGMKVFLATLTWGSTPVFNAHPIEPQRGQDLPPSAIYVRQPASEADQGFWLSEGDTRSIEFNGRPAEVYFGRETLDLPFQVKLLKFSKKDYPGTETAMSFESDVDVGNGPHKIAMNEPLQMSGFTVYQASYVMNENGPPDSIFSVNRDPGRPVKYSGSLILALGIIIFTITRSRVTKRSIG
jgi:hypothetical protein